MPTKQFLIGKLIGTHGIRGELKLACDYPDLDFDKIKRVVVAGHSFLLSGYRYHKKNILISLDNLQNINDVLHLVGQQLFITEDIAQECQQTFSEEVIGLNVYSKKGALLGIVNDILQTPAHDILVIQKSDGKELLVPFIKPFLVSKTAAGVTLDLEPLQEYETL